MTSPVSSPPAVRISHQPQVNSPEPAYAWSATSSGSTSMLSPASMPRTNTSVRAPNDRTPNSATSSSGSVRLATVPSMDGASGALDREGAQDRLHAVDGDQLSHQALQGLPHDRRAHASRTPPIWRPHAEHHRRFLSW